MSYGDDYGRPRVPVRLILAAILVVIGFVTYMSQTQVNPVTGKKQHIAMTVDQEKALGLEAAPQMAREMGGAVPKDDPRAQLVSHVGLRIIDESEAGRSPYADNFHFHLLSDPKTVNAFALPGGQIFITLGLLNRLQTEAQLAGVLGHEVGHVINRHAAQQMAKGQLGQMLATAVGVGASDGRGHGRDAQIAAMMVNQMAQLHYSRADESESDQYGMRIMAQAGYDPRAMLDVMMILKQASPGGRTPEILATHPLPETRIDAIRAELARQYPDGVPENLREGRTLREGTPVERSDG